MYPWKPLNKNWGTVLLWISWCVENLLHPATLKFQFDLKYKILRGTYDIGKLLRDE